MVLSVWISWIEFAAVLLISMSAITTKKALSIQDKLSASLSLKVSWLLEISKKVKSQSCLICLGVISTERMKPSVGVTTVDCKDLYSCDTLLNENAPIERRGILTDSYAIDGRLITSTIAYRIYLHNPLVCYG